MGLIHIAKDPVTGGWRWIYIVQDAITADISLIIPFVLIDFPGSSRNTFLTADEAALHIEPVTASRILEAALDPKTFIFAFMYMTGAMGSYVFALFLPLYPYFGVFLGEIGVSALLTSVLAWQANNIHGDARRSIYSAILIVFGGIGGIFATLIFRTQDAPKYVPGIIAIMSCCGTTFAFPTILMITLRWANRRADQGKSVIFVLNYT
ncbi:hypothetical protein ASPZODRAFT_19233 [Penicilliopsis zonata CBS 506.65]|uniref:Major facilitator superfamily (MFS) profile domain-containing protein n=1 Tax=Penicilliopsis zonata CBS 506.65 TaxID=1073090 RepID=A0A1L9S8M2_9EURO|nr:hypothetical protein ASPZODRAFT_19233 [Penicilliopsis zonata CBS 506.65]OJJ43510.1 hypothetical protein ASPZODRAFT_19233 [Penicilliopsis zonata CBS 506.65]